MNPLRLTPALLLFATVLATAPTLFSQQSFAARFAAHNSEMTALQPAMVTPLVAADPRLIQYVRLAASHEYSAARTETVNYGNARGAGIIAANRFEFDWLPPPYIQHNSAAIDGFGDTSLAVKYRVASGDSENGNFDVAAILVHSFATGSHDNGAATGAFVPTLVAVQDFHRFAAISSLSGTMPTGKIALQGRTIAWNALSQFHATPHVWFEIENNATFYFAGSHDGKMQNFITPAAFYTARRKDWKPAHPFALFACGMQVATSGFHTYNHNLVSEMRVLF
jgi:hypothetical protein